MTRNIHTMAGARPGQIVGRAPSKAERAELIARMVGRVRRRDYQAPADMAYAMGESEEAVRDLLWIEEYANFVVRLDQGPTVDATPLWGGRRIEVDADACECLFSPWPQGSMFTVNPDGKGIVGTWFWSTCQEDYAKPEMREAIERMPDAHSGRIGPARTWNDVMWQDSAVKEHWDDIAQVTQGLVWVGGPETQHDGSTRWAVRGPMWTIALAVDFDGKLRGTQVLSHAPGIEEGLVRELSGSDQALLVLLFDYLNLRNIEIAPAADLPWRVTKRLARDGVTISELTILPVGKYRRHDRDRVPLGEGVPFTPVRGHPIRSGIDGRKHLFGFDGQGGRPLVEGRFWVPSHARGSREVGEVIQEFTLGEEGGGDE